MWIRTSIMKARGRGLLTVIADEGLEFDADIAEADARLCLGATVRADHVAIQTAKFLQSRISCICGRCFGHDGGG